MKNTVELKNIYSVNKYKKKWHIRNNTQEDIYITDDKEEWKRKTEKKLELGSKDYLKSID